MTTYVSAEKSWKLSNAALDDLASGRQGRHYRLPRSARPEQFSLGCAHSFVLQVQAKPGQFEDVWLCLTEAGGDGGWPGQ